MIERWSFSPASKSKQPLIDYACFGSVGQVVFCLVLPVNDFMSSSYITNVGTWVCRGRKGVPGHHLHRSAGVQGLRFLDAPVVSGLN